jgi:hypothetical protein
MTVDYEYDAEPCDEGMCQCSCGNLLHPCGCYCPRCPDCRYTEENCECEDEY